MRKVLKFALLFSLIVTFFLLTLDLLVHPFKYQTTNIEDYGKYIGNVDNKTARRLITSFFPPEIEQSYSNVEYSYRSERGDTVGFEAYLAFSIVDKSEYADHVSQIASKYNCQVFPYDPEYSVYTIASQIHPDGYYYNASGDTHIKIHCACIQMVLVSDAKQEIIYVAIDVFEGVAANSEFFSVFFNRFDIDPLEYAISLNPDLVIEEYIQ